MIDSRWWYYSVLRKQFTIFSPFFWCAGLLGCCALPSRRGSGGRSQKPEGSRCSEMHSQPYLSPKWIIPDGNSFLRKSFTFSTLSWCAGLFACGTLPLRPGVWGPQKPEGSRCSEMHSQPYLSPKWIIPDGNCSHFEKIIYLFYPFLVCKAVCLWHTTIGAGGLWAAQGPKSQMVLDALRCILSHIWALNELFQMEILPVLRKSFTFSTLSWCAGLFACGILT